LIDQRPYLVSLPIQSLVPNIQNLVYLLALLNVGCKEPIIPPIYVPLIENVFFVLDPIDHILVLVMGHRECSYNVASYV
jgi:hypothetical protein